MAVKVKSIILWRRDVDNRPGALAETLSLLAGAGANLQVVMGYRYPGDEGRAAIELYPVTGKRATAAAREAGLTASSIPTLLVEGDDRPGLGHALARSLADAGINLSFLVAQVIGRKYTGVLGFESASDAQLAAGLIKKVKASGKRK
jgi:hypothetical protein